MYSSWSSGPGDDRYGDNQLSTSDIFVSGENIPMIQYKFE